MKHLLPLIILPWLLIGCQSPNESSGDRLTVTATTSIIADAVTQVGGDRVKVECLMGPGVDPHRYQPSAGDIAKLSSARVVLYHGLHLEGKMTDILGKPRAGQHRRAVTDSIPPSRLRRPQDEELAREVPHDPHVWFDPRLWTICVQTITDELVAADPEFAEQYRARSKAYIEKIESAHKELLQLAEKLPESKRILVTSHDAFGYFGAAYGFQVRGLQGVSTAAETGTRDIRELSTFLGTHQVRAVFAETSVPPKGLQAVLDAVQSQYNHQVKLVGGDDALYSDALGEKDSPGETYLGMIRHNLTTIVNALR